MKKVFSKNILNNNKLKLMCGFTLIELLISISIFSIIIGISTTSYSIFKSHSNLEIVTNGVVEAIRFAESSATTGKNDSNWGVKLLSNKIFIFKGISYESRDSSFDEILYFAGGVEASGLSEIVFEKINGSTLNTGDIILTNSSGTKNININEKGTITY